MIRAGEITLFSFHIASVCRVCPEIAFCWSYWAEDTGESMDNIVLIHRLDSERCRSSIIRIGKDQIPNASTLRWIAAVKISHTSQSKYLCLVPIPGLLQDSYLEETMLYKRMNAILTGLAWRTVWARGWKGNFKLLPLRCFEPLLWQLFSYDDLKSSAQNVPDVSFAFLWY